MRPRNHGLLISTCSVALLAAASGVSCKSSQQAETTSYFDRTIAPIVTHSCSRQTTGCHVADPKGNAVGNLDTTSFEGIDRRHDLLVTYGPYAAPGLLTKVSGGQTLTVSTLDGPITITTDIRHAAGAGIDVTSEGYATLRRWMDSGASKENVGPSAPHLTPTGDCKSSVPVTDPGYDPSSVEKAYDEFKSKVQPVLKASCSAGSCHGNEVADFSLTCGGDEAQIHWNAYIAAQFLSATPESSELLRRPLDPSRGGVFHEGGVVFSSSDDPGYQAMLTWARNRGGADVDKSDPAFVFFANRVQPTMVRKGCMFLGCHSPQMFHDLRLRGGSGGQFSAVATRRNYAMSRLMLSVESPDPNVSRLLNKNLYPYDRDIDPKGIGARHRGGSLLEDVVDPDPLNTSVHHATLKDCEKIDVEAGDLSATPAYCIFAAWQQKERAQAIAKGPGGAGVSKNPLDGIVYVERPPNTDVPQAFDSYRPGAALHIAAATLGADGKVSMGADADVTGKCGLSSATADIRGPSVSWDGKKIAFAARSSATEPLAIYEMNADGSACGKQAAIGKHDVSGNGILIHDFDPTYAPDGRLVFGSSRGAIGQSDTAYSGPSKTPSMLLPNANLYVVEGDAIRQLTFYLNEELGPDFMRDGRLLLTFEKRAPGFYQLAGRRMNLDGGDSHPLYAQRKSIGYEQLTEIHELADRSFIGVFSDKGALAGGGTIGVINRSLGPDQNDRDPNDHFYLHSLTLPDASATGKPGSAGGAYRSPASLPALSFLASYAAGADVGTFTGEYELVQVDEHDGARSSLVKVSGKAIVDAAAIYARASYGIFPSRLDEVNGATHVDPGQRDAEVRVLDLPMLASLLFTNTRIGRNVDPKAIELGILEELPPPNELTSFDAADPQFVFGSDPYGKFWLKRTRLGYLAAQGDGSLGFRIPGGIPIVLELYSDDPSKSKPYATQREEMQFYPGERARQIFRRDFFDAQCGGCHGSISGREVDVHLRPDVLTSASRVAAFTTPLGNFFVDTAHRGPVVANDPALGK